MKRRIFLCILVFSLLTTPALAKSDYIRWVDFDVDYSAMQRALELDIASQAEEPPLCWIDLLALAATRCGGKGMKASDIDRAAKDFRKNRSPEELLGEQFKYYSYYHEAYHAALGGLVGSYAIQVRRENGETEWSRSIAEQVKRLSGLTEQLVQLARMDEGAAFAKEAVDLSELVEEMAEPFYQLAQQRGKTLAADVAPNVQVQGDASALSQVVELLLDNATRYAKEGTQIQLRLRKQGRKAKLSVSNEVEHMPKGNLDKLFERFYRDDASRSSQTGGSGVGLSVVRSIAEAHGGTAKATAQGNIIMFTVTL